MSELNQISLAATQLICNKTKVVKSKLMSLKGGVLPFPPPRPVRHFLPNAAERSLSAYVCVHVDKFAALHLASQAAASLLKQGLSKFSSHGLTTSQRRENGLLYICIRGSKMLIAPNHLRPSSSR